jgi:hypothetical protein
MAFADLCTLLLVLFAFGMLLLKLVELTRRG